MPWFGRHPNLVGDLCPCVWAENPADLASVKVDQIRGLIEISEAQARLSLADLCLTFPLDGDPVQGYPAPFDVTLA